MQRPYGRSRLVCSGQPVWLGEYRGETVRATVIMEWQEQEGIGVFPLFAKKRKQLCLVCFDDSLLVITVTHVGSLRGFYGEREAVGT